MMETQVRTPKMAFMQNQEPSGEPFWDDVTRVAERVLPGLKFE